MSSNPTDTTLSGYLSSSETSSLLQSLPEADSSSSNQWVNTDNTAPKIGFLVPGLLSPVLLTVDVNPLAEYEEPVGAFAFHQTHPENIDSIRAVGIKHTTESESNTTTIDTVLTDLGYDSPFPFDRTAVTYCHVDAAYVAETLPSPTDTGLMPDEVTIVIDVARLTAPIYLADMSFVSDLIDYLHGGADIMLHADTPSQAVKRYRDSITLVETPADIAGYVDTGVGHAELIVDGDIPPDAIVKIVEQA